jgi:hypothetical protein
MGVRVELTTDDIGIIIAVPGGHSPDVMRDVSNQAVDLFARTIAIYRTYDTTDDDG